jgi:NADP-dependent 3-hydroxy acid dehydrogenase YdfG
MGTNGGRQYQGCAVWYRSRAAAYARAQARPNHKHVVCRGAKVFPASAVYSATKFAVRAISEGLRLESNGEIRSTNISPGAVATELPNTISDDAVAKTVNALYADAIDADAIARAIVYAIEQPEDVDVNEIVVRPTTQEL